jgi:hypothetical protein
MCRKRKTGEFTESIQKEIAEFPLSEYCTAHKKNKKIAEKEKGRQSRVGIKMNCGGEKFFPSCRIQYNTGYLLLVP